MALQIKKGSEISPYGEYSKSFTSEDNLSQEVLEHLQTRFPDDIEETEKKEKPNKIKS